MHAANEFRTTYDSATRQALERWQQAQRLYLTERILTVAVFILGHALAGVYKEAPTEARHPVAVLDVLPGI